MLFLVLSSATAARKTKRPVKPAKTFPRTNVTPSPQAAASSSSTTTTAQPAISSTTSSTAAPLLKTENVSIEEADLPGNIVQNDSELPKPLESAAAAASATNGNAQLPQESKTEKPMAESGNGGGMVEEECDPDMIGFEIITG